jgi:ribosome-associated protein
MDEEAPSKSARKREDRALRELGLRLAGLPDDQRAALPLDEALRAAIEDYRAIRSFEARRRQAHFVGRLMRRADVAAIEIALAAIEGRSAAARFAQHELTRWRDRLLGEDAALREFVAAYPATDVPALRALVRRARARPDEAAHARALFRFLRETVRQAVRQAGGENDPTDDDSAHA